MTYSRRSDSQRSLMSSPGSSSVVGRKKIRIKPRSKILPENRSFRQKIPHYLLIGCLIIYTFIILFGEVLLLPPNPQSWCIAAQRHPTTYIYRNKIKKQYENPDYNKDPCRHEHHIHLLYMSISECDYARRMLISVILGSIIGIERKSADRPAGLRTMSLVSLGSCFFTMCGQLGFRSSTMHWDAARVSAAIPSGVGFLGTSLIWKSKTHGDRQQVHGLTTAAGVWLSAAIGVGVGGGLYVCSIFCVILVVLVLRIGPRIYLGVGDDSVRSGGTGNFSAGVRGGSDYDGEQSVKNGNHAVTKEEYLWLLKRETSIMSNSESNNTTANPLQKHHQQQQQATSIYHTNIEDHKYTKSADVEVKRDCIPTSSIQQHHIIEYSSPSPQKILTKAKIRRNISLPNLQLGTKDEESEEDEEGYFIRGTKSAPEFFVPIKNNNDDHSHDHLDCSNYDGERQNNDNVKRNRRKKSSTHRRNRRRRARTLSPTGRDRPHRICSGILADD